MKKEQVPQDDANLMEGRTRELCYALNENGEYVQVLSAGWEPKNLALQQAWALIDTAVREAVAQVRAGKASPLAIFMAQGQFDLALLSEYTDLPKRKIKAHLTPEGFDRLDRQTLEKYAAVFDITAEALIDWEATVAAFLDTVILPPKDGVDR